MYEIQNALFEKINKNGSGKILLRYAAILIYISVGHGILEMIPMPSFIATILRYISRIVYFGYIAGLIGCFAKKDFLPITIVFFFDALTSLISCIRWFSFGSVVNVIVYGILGYYALTYFNKNRANTGVPGVNGKKFCPNCGQEVSADVSFCGNCGNKFLR